MITVEQEQAQDSNKESSSFDPRMRQGKIFKRFRYRFSWLLIYEVLQRMASAGGQINKSRLVHVTDWTHLNEVLMKLLESENIGIVRQSKTKYHRVDELYMTDKGKHLLRLLYDFDQVAHMKKL